MCQLVAKLLNCAAEESCVVGSRRLERIQRAMLVRLHDKVGKDVQEGEGGHITLFYVPYYDRLHTKGELAQ